MQHLMEPVNEWAVINHPLQPLVLKLHILVAPVMVFAVGMVAVNHMAVTWATLLGILAWTHLVLGVLAGGALLGHRVAVARGLRARKGALRVLPAVAAVNQSDGG
jgi:hypothetical protein